MSSGRPSRTEQRERFDMPVRIALVENDVDEVESEFIGFRSELVAIRRLLTGIFASVTGAAIVLAINVIVLGGGR